MITAQQPVNTVTGFANLINTTLPDNTNCTLQSDGVECQNAEEILQLSLLACSKSLVVVVMDTNNSMVVVNKTLTSSQQPQKIEYMLVGEQRRFNISIKEVEFGGDYFILSLDNALTALQFPDTAIPLHCSESSTGKTSYIARHEKW